jgi:hypothetical protein
VDDVCNAIAEDKGWEVMQMLPTPNVQIEQARRGRGINIFIFTFYLEVRTTLFTHLPFLLLCTMQIDLTLDRKIQLLM